MKKTLIIGLIVLAVVGTVMATQYRMKYYIDNGLYPSDVIKDAMDSSATARTSILGLARDSAATLGASLGTYVDTVLRVQAFGNIMGGYDTIATSAETVKACIYVVPATGVTSVTVKNVSFIAQTPPNVAGGKIAWAQVKMRDDTDSTFKAITSRTVLDTHSTATLKAYRTKAITIDSTTNAVLYPGDAVWGYFFVDSANVLVKNLGVGLNLSINK